MKQKNPHIPDDLVFDSHDHWWRTLCQERAEFLAALAPFLAEYKKRDPIGDSDLDNEQPVHITVTLGDCRRARAAIQAAEGN